MRTFPALVVLLLAGTMLLPPAAASIEGGPGPPGGVAGRAPPGIPQGLLDIITPQKVSERVNRLASLGTRFSYTTKTEEAADYIFGELGSTGLSTFRQSFFHNGYTLTNVVAVSPGRNASLPWCVVGAHYDSLNGTDWSFNPYAPAPGADDDASGVAAVLGLADAFARAPTNRTILFAAFCGEEQGRAGSREFVRQLAENNTALAGAVCLDMIGFNNFPKVDIVTDAGSSWLADMAMTAARHCGLIPETVVANHTPIRWSDQLSFWEAGYPSIYFIEDENPFADSAHYKANPYYHSGGDTPEKLNLSLMTSVARAAAATVARLAGLALPDLSPVLAPRPHEALAGEPALFNVSVSNKADAVASANLSFFVDGAVLDNRTIVPDGIQSVYMSWMPEPGAHTVAIVANPDGRYVEWDRTDNTIVFGIEISARPETYISGIWASDAEPLPGEPLYVYVWMGNSGGAPASGRLVVCSDQGAVLLDMDAELPAGEEQAVVVATTAPSQPVDYTACLTAVMPWEWDTGNNQKTLGISPHMLDTGGFFLAAVPEAGPTLRQVRFDVQGAPADGGLEYNFDFGDGACAGWTSCPSMVHAFAAGGTYNATVSVRDARGAYASLPAVPVLIHDQLPVPEIETDGTAVHAGVPAVFSSARSFDPDGGIAGQNWEFGDGAVALGSNVSHVFGALRPYTVRLTVVDGAGNYNITTMQVTVIDDPPAPVLSVGSRVISIGEDVLLDGSGSFDGDGKVSAYQWSFGDGGTGEGPMANYSFAKPGRYAVNLTVTDDWGVSSSTTTEVFVYARPARQRTSPSVAGPQAFIMAAAIVLVLILLAAAVLMKSRPRGRRGRDEEE